MRRLWCVCHAAVGLGLSGQALTFAERAVLGYEAGESLFFDSCDSH